MVWLLPYAETGRVWVIILITYLVGLTLVAVLNHAQVTAGGDGADLESGGKEGSAGRD